MKARGPRKTKIGGFRIKRVYEPAAEDDGLRVLVDRLWPRGIAKEKARTGDLDGAIALARAVLEDEFNTGEMIYRRSARAPPQPTGHAALRGTRRDPQQRGRAEMLAGTAELMTWSPERASQRS